MFNVFDQDLDIENSCFTPTFCLLRKDLNLLQVFSFELRMFRHLKQDLESITHLGQGILSTYSVTVVLQSILY